MNGALPGRFWMVWAAASTTNLGDGLTLVAFPLMATSITNDARLIALVSTFRFLPFLLIGLPAGVIIDRFDRRYLAMVAQTIRALAVAGLVVGLAANRESIGLLAAAAFVVGVGEILTDGGLPAIVRAVVNSSQLEVANSRLLATETVTNTFIGPPLGAFLFQLSPSAPFVGSVILFGATTVGLGLVPGQFRASSDLPLDPNGAADTAMGLAPGEPGTSIETDSPPASVRQQILVGLSYVWGHPVLRPLALTVALFSFVGEAGNAIFVLVATEGFGLTEFQFGLLMSVDGVVSVIMSFFVARLIGRTSYATSMRLSIITYSAGALLFGFGGIVALAIAAAVLQGVSDPTWNVASGTIRQRLVPNEVFGRMMTAYLFLAWGMQPLGAMMGGVVAQAWGAQWVFVISGLSVGSLLVLGRPLFRALDQAVPPQNTS